MKRGFTTIELVMVVALMAVFLAIAFSFFGRPASHSKATMEQTVAFGSARRVMILLAQHVKTARKILLPNETQKVSSYLLVEKKDGVVHQFFYDQNGHFTQRYRDKDSNPKMSIMVRRPGKNTRIQNVQFQYQGPKFVTFSAFYERQNKDGEFEPLVEALDSLAIK